MTAFKLSGRIIITANIRVVTGLHIGGTGGSLEIGGVDNPVIRNPITNQPYIPGSSLRGKMRSQTEKREGADQNNRIGQVKIHTCRDEKSYNAKGGCLVCQIFGVPAEIGYSGPTRLVVRDVYLSPASAARLEAANTDTPFAEVKTEVAIDRVTSAASPRNQERVPAGAVFGPAELVFGLYEPADIDRLKTVFEALQLVEDDYLGGGGSRGNGKIAFEDLTITLRASTAYGEPKAWLIEKGTVQGVLDQFADLKTWLTAQIKF